MLSRREWFLSTLATGAACSSDNPASTAGRPNILFVFSDDQSYPHASILGDPVVRTPGFDRVAREGVILSHSFTACPSCTPSRTSVLTGRQMWQTGEGGLLYGTIEPQYPLFTHALEDAGYHVGFTGAGWKPGDWAAAGLKRHPLVNEYNDRQATSPPPGIDTRDYAANFDDFLADRPRDAPFFFWFGATEPHRDYDPSPGVRDVDAAAVPLPPYFPDAAEVREEILDYYDEIEHYDSHVVRMLERLQESGELDNTLVVVTSDNGMPFARTKSSLYDGGTRMPTAVRWPKRIPGGRTVDDFQSHIDWAPTFLAAAGVEAPDATEGKSLLPVLEAEGAGRIDPDRDHVVTGIERHTWCRPEGATYPIRAIRTYDYLYIRNFEPDRWPTGGPTFISSNKAPHGDVDDGPFKDFLFRPDTAERFSAEFALCAGKRPLEELYDVRSDPHQIRNLADDPAHAEVKKALWDRLRTYLSETGDPRIEGRDPWQQMAYRQTDGFGAVYNRLLSEEERQAARDRGKHAVGHTKEEGH